MFLEQLVPGMVLPTLTDVDMDAYREPFTDPSTRLPLWRWPNELPIGGEPADVHEIVSAYAAKLQESDLPKMLFHAAPGAIITPPMLEMLRQSYKNLKTVDIGEEIAAWYKTLLDARAALRRLTPKGPYPATLALHLRQARGERFH